jgi:hypothetical protein
MDRNALRYIVAALALVLLIGMVLTGLLIKYVLPPGSGGRLGGPALVLWGLDRHDWGAVHWWIALVLLIITLVHLLLHWTWVVTLPNRWLRGSKAGSAPPSPRARARALVIFLLAVAGLTGGWLGLARSQVTQRERQHLGRQESRQDYDRAGGRGRGQQMDMGTESVAPPTEEADDQRGSGQGRQHRGGRGGGGGT